MTKQKEFGEIFRRVTDEKNAPAAEIVVKKRGETLFSARRGYADRENKTPLADDTVFYMYSMTKPVTVALAMMLVEEGKMALSDEVASYLPEYRDAFLLDGERRVPPARAIAIGDLFTMRSGLDYHSHGFASPHVQALAGKGSTRDFAAAFVRTPLCFTPGERFLYGLSHDVLAATVETVAGKKFRDFAEERLFGPLGMTRTSFHGYDPARLAAEYIADEQSNYTRATDGNGFVFSPDYDSGGAGLVSNAEDYAKFADMLASGGTARGRRFLSEKSVADLRTPRVREGIFTPIPGEEDAYAYGLGVRVRTRASEHTPVGEFGWDGAAGSYVCADTASGLSVTLVLNVRGYTLCGYGRVHAALREAAFRLFG